MSRKTEMEEVSQAMIDGVMSDDLPLQFESIAKIRSILSRRDITIPCETVIRSGIMPRLVQFLDKQEYPTLQYEAAWILKDIATEKPNELVDHDAVPFLIQLLNSPTEYIREQAILALGNVAGHSTKYRDFVLQLGVLMPLLSLMYKGKSKTLRSGTRTLCNLFCGQPPLTFDQMKPALPALKLLLHSNDEEVVKNACLALSNISYGSEDGIQSLIEADFVPKLVQLLKHPSPAVLVHALRTIGDITAGNNQQTRSVVNCGALPILSDLLTRNYEKNIKKSACWVISNITAGTEEQIQSVIDESLIPTLVNLAQSADIDIKKEAVWAILGVVVGGSLHQIKYMVKQSCIKPLCDILVCPDLRTSFLSKCLDGLENILKAGEVVTNVRDRNCYALLIEGAEGLEKIKNLQSHENNEISVKALKILGYWLVEDDEKYEYQSDESVGS
ncbi:PREDICTED: importin subunit alpha-8-like isoform X2 [Camelina sativa]|uniref:Importin subunit alpha n=1 Tax=Camelina sativa TaxID=90675 RepID=A0ABM0UPP2_CAMSA|nr:PREDICTED: importin subunit alpha-8-like isoform X2 [Camelina sativa]